MYVFNFDPSRSYPDYPVMVPPGGTWRLAYNSDERRFGGQGRIAPGQRFTPEFALVNGNERVSRVRLYLPARTALVIRRE